MMRQRLSTWLIAVAIPLVAGLAPDLSALAADLEGFGPVSVRNFQPFQLLFIGLPGDRAAVLPPKALDVRLELAETATIFNEQSSAINAQVKFETLRSGLFLRYGFMERLELGLEIPVYYRSRGFLGGAITGVERATTGLSPARAALGNTSFAFRVSRNGRVLMQSGDDHMGPGDITLSTKYQAMTERQWWPTLSLRGAIKLPSGDSARFFGSGHTDFGVGIAAEKKLGAQWMAYANANGLFPTGDVSGLHAGPAVTGLFAIEYLWSPQFTVVAQFEGYSSFYRNTGVGLYDKGVTEAALGFSYLFQQRFLWQVYGVENLDFIRDSAADFTLATVLTYRFNR
jgi:hypothetical protein